MPIRYCSEFLFSSENRVWFSVDKPSFLICVYFYTLPNSISLVFSVQRNFSDISRRKNTYGFSRQKCRQIILESHSPLFLWIKRIWSARKSSQKFPKKFPARKNKIETSLFSIQDSPSNWSSGQVLTLFCFKYRSPLRPTMGQKKICKKIRIFKQCQSFGGNLPEIWGTFQMSRI